MQRQGWCCPGTGLQGLHVGVVLNLLQPSLWVHRYKVRKPLRVLGLPKMCPGYTGTAQPHSAHCSLHGWFRASPTPGTTALGRKVTQQQPFFGRKP